MSAIINALFGIYPEPEPLANQTVVEQNASSSSERLQTSAIANDVQVQSAISSNTEANATLQTRLNVKTLLAQLKTTHAQVDQYSQARTAEINEQMQKLIADVLVKTQLKEEELVQEANRRQGVIDNEYKLQLHKAIEALDIAKARTLADLERDLQVKQQKILSAARDEIDQINDQGQIAKLNALVETQGQAKQNIDHLVDQMAALAQQETQTLLESTTTTVITSQTQAAGNAEKLSTTPIIMNSVVAEGLAQTAGARSVEVGSAANLPATPDATAAVVPIAAVEIPAADIIAQSSDGITTLVESHILPNATQNPSNGSIGNTELKTTPTDLTQ